MHGYMYAHSQLEEKMKKTLTHFLRFGRSLLTQRRRHDLPVLWRRPLDRMELQSLWTYFFTWFMHLIFFCFRWPFPYVLFLLLFPVHFFHYSCNERQDQQHNTTQCFFSVFLYLNQLPFVAPIKLLLLTH